MPGAISRRELIRKFRALGFIGPIPGKRHQFVKKDALKVRIPNPHKSGTIGEPLLKEILRQAAISREEWDEV
ncbi:MAG: type II toxin-antitoxin system HicA family toxin [Acidobacteria bacterium]|nr:type II toxin-antitoxin system HicA family toxin [Acidobacteriota bacterium]